MNSTRLVFDDERIGQVSGNTISLSGTNNFHGTLTIQSGATLNILDNAGDGKVLTSDASGNMSLQAPPPPTVAGDPNNILVVSSGGTQVVDSGISVFLVLAGL